MFTGTKSTDDYEVVQFTVKAVMDQRDISRLVAKLCNNTFYTLVRTSYLALPPNLQLKGKIYGSEPAVNVVLEFEAVLLGEVFRPLMPQEVCEAYEIKCPSHEAGGKDEG